jgi:hypothetical protein
LLFFGFVDPGAGERVRGDLMVGVDTEGDCDDRLQQTTREKHAYEEEDKPGCLFSIE